MTPKYIHNTLVFAVDSRLLLCSVVWAGWRQEEALRHSGRGAAVQAGLSREVAPVSHRLESSSRAPLAPGLLTLGDISCSLHSPHPPPPRVP